MSEEDKAHVTKLVIDAMKPREISIISLAKIICNIRNVKSVNIVVKEVDVKTETIKLTITGPRLDFNEINDILVENGTVVRSVDEVGVEKEV